MRKARCQECNTVLAWMIDGVDQSMAKAAGVFYPTNVGAAMCIHCDFGVECCTDWVMGRTEPVLIDYRARRIIALGWKPRRPMSGETARPLGSVTPITFDADDVERYWPPDPPQQPNHPCDPIPLVDPSTEHD